MTANSMQLYERQVVNIADGKCLGNLKDIELNLWTGTIEALILPALNGFWYRIPHTGEQVIGWEKVVRIGVDVILIDAPELSEQGQMMEKGKRAKKKKLSAMQPAWQKEAAAYQEALQQESIIVLDKDAYREV